MFLLVGGDSEIGAATARRMIGQKLAVAATTRRHGAVSPTRPFLDLAAPLDDWRPPADLSAACICVAVARLAACAADPVASERLNVAQTLALVDRLLEQDVHVLFLSTNQVFDGSRPHNPADAPHSPISEYGRQKARTEAALLGYMKQGAPVAILRLSKVVAPDMPLLRGWIESLRRHNPIRAFHDMTMAPVPLALASEAIAALLQSKATGIFQFTGPRDVSYAETARHLARRLGVDPGLVEETRARDNGQPAGATPRNTTLDGSAIRQRFGLECPDAWGVVDTVLA